MTTREQILLEALHYFSLKGYGEVSVREIAKAVGIKESSLYYHFSNKQAIFDELVSYCFNKNEEYYKQRSIMTSPNDDLSGFNELSEEMLIIKMIEIFKYYFKDPICIEFRRLLIISQYQTPKASTMYKKLYYDIPIKIQTSVFENLINRGELQSVDSNLISIEFYSVIFMLIHTVDNFDEVKLHIRAHVHQFLQNYQIRGEK